MEKEYTLAQNILENSVKMNCYLKSIRWRMFYVIMQEVALLQAGHIVIWEGQGMMMKTCCGIVGNCRHDRMTVNSPRWKSGRRVRSESKGRSFITRI